MKPQSSVWERWAQRSPGCCFATDIASPSGTERAPKPTRWCGRGTGPRRWGCGRREPHRRRLRLRLPGGEQDTRHGGGRFRSRRPGSGSVDHRESPGGAGKRGVGTAAGRRLRRGRHPGGSEPDGEAGHDHSRVGCGIRVPDLAHVRRVPKAPGGGHLTKTPSARLALLERGLRPASSRRSASTATCRPSFRGEGLLKIIRVTRCPDSARARDPRTE